MAPPDYEKLYEQEKEARCRLERALDARADVQVVADSWHQVFHGTGDDPKHTELRGYIRRLLGFIHATSPAAKKALEDAHGPVDL